MIPSHVDRQAKEKKIKQAERGFWMCVVGFFLNLLLFFWMKSIAPGAGLFPLITMACFAIGGVANYLQLPEEKH